MISGKTFPTYDPRTEEVIAQVAEGDAEDINCTVSAAREAFDNGPWPKMTAYISISRVSLSWMTFYWFWTYNDDDFWWLLQERSHILLRFADLVEKHNDEIAALETWNNGKPYNQTAKTEVPIFVRLFRYYTGTNYQ